MSIFRSADCVLLHVVFSTRCCGCGPKEPVCSLVHLCTRQGVGLRPVACCDHGFECHRGHGHLSVVSVVCCQVEVSATS